MPPKRAPPTSRPSARASGPPARQEQPGTIGGALRNTYDALTAQENRSVLKAVGFAGVSGGRFYQCLCDELALWTMKKFE